MALCERRQNHNKASKGTGFEFGPTKKIFDFQCFRLAENAHKSEVSINFTTTHSITQTCRFHMISVALNGLKGEPLKNEREIAP